jgi:hypothetical protein
MLELSGPDQRRDEDTECRAVEMKIGLPPTVIDEHVAISMHTEKELRATTMRMLAACLIFRNAKGEEVALWLEGQPSRQFTDSQVPARRIDAARHLVEAHSAYGCFTDAGWRQAHAQSGDAASRWIIVRTSDWGLPDTVRKARPTYSPMIPSISN